MIRTREAIVKEAHKFIFNLSDCLGDEVFQVDTLEELGKYYYQKTLQSIDSLTNSLLNDLINFVAFRKSEPENVDEYYKAICRIASIQSVPGPILADVRRKYNEIFIEQYERVKIEAATSLQTIEQKILEIERENSQIKVKTESVTNGSFIKNIEADYARIKELTFELRLLETNKESIIKNEELLDARLMEFCNIQDLNSIEQAVRKTAIDLARDKDVSTDKLGSVFAEYQIWIDVVEDNIKRPHALFYKVKFIPFINEFEKEYRILSFKNPDEAKNRYKDKMESLPRINDLHQLKQNNSHEYFEKLQFIISNYLVINRISDLIYSSPALYNRKNLLLKILALYESKQYELFANIAPIQIEGIITDYLYDELTFRRFTDIAVYPKAVLRKKIELLEDLGSNVSPDAMLYFYYSFNNIVRNNIAHGAFENLCFDEMQAKVFSAEILLDMLYIVHVISISSETTKMTNFIHGYIEHYKMVIKTDTKNQHFGALFNDLIGAKIIYNNGMVEKFKPLQVVYWILNPTYEKIYATVHDNTDLLELRQSLLSKEFWKYVSGTLNDIINAGYDYLNISSEFFSIVKGLFTCGVDPEVKKVLAEVNAQLTQIRNLTD